MSYVDVICPVWRRWVVSGWAQLERFVVASVWYWCLISDEVTRVLGICLLNGEFSCFVETLLTKTAQIQTNKNKSRPVSDSTDLNSLLLHFTFHGLLPLLSLRSFPVWDHLSCNRSAESAVEFTLHMLTKTRHKWLCACSRRSRRWLGVGGAS